ncbi:MULTISPECIES: sensor histidine kinase [unclassified Pseudomonas]|uniref:sensor histidine kinase n=1 Tax=unclassified Pseudomonas TaxID=196821 RepID=UPI002AC99B09|nr:MULTISPECIES: histidine kinase [unclassified Pseudomonas]MEB0046821.1 histidine kinase [Pseudomonas sp. Dout3]MEB0099303.1 histidine kinase [Pseudomonas sp. DC1.2]WPX61221.1 histidine kinase [Pseudomonas sp. DC1.2]
MSRQHKCACPPACLGAIENERLRIACDLHDHAGQHLALAQLCLAELQRHAAAPALQPLIEQLQRLIHEASASLRTVVQNLGNEPMPRQSLDDALRGLVLGMQQRFPDAPTIVLNLQGPPIPLADSITQTLLRAVSELLANVRKHSGATQATLSSACHEHSLTVCVEDNGHGFAPALKGQWGGFGLRSIALQLKPLEGRVLLDSELGRGTFVRLLVPTHRGCHSARNRS